MQALQKRSALAAHSGGLRLGFKGLVLEAIGLGNKALALDVGRSQVVDTERADVLNITVV
jgi:hypothetical protein